MYQIKIMFNRSRWANNCTVTPLFYICCYGAFYIMPTVKYSFYRRGQLVYICYTQRKSDDYESDLVKRGVEYELKVERLF